MTEAITFEDVQAAHQRLHDTVNHTPIMTSRTLNARTGRTIFLKCENFQRGGAFKFRGAYNAVSQLTPAARHQGVLAVSSGNHAQGIALAAKLLETPAVICMPDDAPQVKVNATREYGAEVIFYERRIADREAFGDQVAAERGLTVIPSYDHPHIMAGAGTAAHELLNATPDLDTVVAPVGGGGLLSGSAIATHGHNTAMRIFGVEPAIADDVRQSFQAGERRCIAPPTTIADGLRVQAPGALTFPVIYNHVTDIITVSEEEILETVRFACTRLKLVIEPSGAVPLAALLYNKLPTNAQRVGVIISGGNIDPAVLLKLWDH
ncbi:MAG: pyridoxal-phosphate dependent enzyme [Chloroflexi bacterium AL-W]|nr:pyridoxal-phosphate dependent enzyme [Chloroflexi bacterium AL-N1]NOK68659.1 pyridoxal-phosphate dependent enzyme [Chloroflexi bacterium AL-N10]NOK76145.1 pyridoxal-phosphate dependent enzyme [Chloroflexi bacterium AL-N5]NOK84218.1 pyridoxal-phosphate dependent enzyme [Chloroflexi bacterium AL-W]NOK91283.1 pyridoxal-phosphate dependent enzyme [Chloroflexi bacterium AL-N15]